MVFEYFLAEYFLKTPYFGNKPQGGGGGGEEEDHSTSSYCTHKPLYCTNKPLFHHISYSPSLMILDFGPLERSSTDVATSASDYILNNSQFWYNMSYCGLLQTFSYCGLDLKRTGFCISKVVCYKKRFL